MAEMDPRYLATDAKLSGALLREGRSVRRRLDKLASTAAEVEPVTSRLLADAQTAVGQLVDHLARQERVQHQLFKTAVRHAARPSKPPDMRP